MKLLSLSKIEHAAACAYPFRADVEVPEQPTNEFAVAGTELGAGIYALINGLPIPDMGEKAAAFFEQWCLYYDLTDFGLVLAEPSFAFNTVTGEIRWLGINIGRDYGGAGQTEEDICGSIDIACRPADGILTVYEIKSGRQHYLTRFKTPQARGYAAILARHLGESHVRVIICVVDEDGVKEYPDELYQVDIDDTLSYIMNLDEGITLGEPQPTPGPHCRSKYCALAATCPALVQAATDIMRPIPVPLTTKADVAATVTKLLALEAQAAAIWKMVDARVEEMGEDIELPNGKSYGAKATTREYIKVTPAARALLEETLGPEAVEEAVKVSITKASIKEGVKKCAAKGKAASMERDVLGKLRDLGVVGESTSLGYGVK